MDRSSSFDLALLGKYDQPAPRYTTYPRRASLRDDVSVADYRQAAQSSNEDPIPKPVTAYVHVPFCHRLCHHCTVGSIVAQDADKTARYVGYLKREIALQGALFDHDRPIERLAFGGGTPTCLSDIQLAELLNELHRHFGLNWGRDRDVSLQIDPLNIEPERMATLAALGFTRLSFGVRALDPTVQGAIARPLDAGRLAELVGAARHARFRTLGIDMMLGLPGQSPEGLATTLEILAALRPERITLYRHTPQGRGITKEPEGWLMHKTTLALLQTGVTKLTAAGYVHLGMGYFVLPTDALALAQRQGRLQHNLEGYIAGPETDRVALGAGAIGQVGDNYYQNAPELLRYYTRLDAGELAVCQGYELNSDDRLRRDVIHRLMSLGEVDFRAIERRHRIVFRNYFAPELIELTSFVRDGLVEIRRDALVLLPSGRLLTNRVAMIFDRMLNGLKPGRLQVVR